MKLLFDLILVIAIAVVVYFSKRGTVITKKKYDEAIEKAMIVGDEDTANRLIEARSKVRG